MGVEASVAYAGYLVWLAAGLGDFACHRRTDLPRTSGVAESVMHLLQIGVLGVAIVVGLAFELGPAIAWVLAGLVVVHSVLGYVDTRIAFGRKRVILPVEQHLHSVMDMAPVVALGWGVATSWPAAIAGSAVPVLRSPALPVEVWVAVLVPAALLCVLPALSEFVSARKANVGY